MARIFKSIALVLLCLIFAKGEVCAAQVAVIVNSSGPLVNVTDEDIKEIYLGEKKFEGDVKIYPLLYPEGEIKAVFLKEAMNMTPKEYKLYWTKKVFQEGTPVPKTPLDSDEIIGLVKGNKGGIGFIRRDMVKNLTGIKVIRVMGR